MTRARSRRLASANFSLCVCRPASVRDVAQPVKKLSATISNPTPMSKNHVVAIENFDSLASVRSAFAPPATSRILQLPHREPANHTHSNKAR
jgi:hypothetical protein